jgi:cytochrome c
VPNRIPTFILMCALICGTLATRASAGEWTVADVDSLPMDIFGRTVRAGRDLIVHTAATIGPDAPDPARRYSGNGLECESCHLDAGTKKFGLPLAGIWGVFPLFIGRENEVRTLEDRINGCMERSMNGRALPPDGPEMKAMLTYICSRSTISRLEQLPIDEDRSCRRRADRRPEAAVRLPAKPERRHPTTAGRRQI